MFKYWGVGFALYQPGSQFLGSRNLKQPTPLKAFLRFIWQFWGNSSLRELEKQ
ncbi:hypothetical protein U0070_023500 [Myodes glareolus]|uniref:Uncharacterized protein n=1 Tax=Myodes glareolus TaxID=447135 RepID=A0AAW0HI21_MYOGA